MSSRHWAAFSKARGPAELELLPDLDPAARIGMRARLRGQLTTLLFQHGGQIAGVLDAREVREVEFLRKSTKIIEKTRICSHSPTESSHFMPFLGRECHDSSILDHSGAHFAGAKAHGSHLCQRRAASEGSPLRSGPAQPDPHSASHCGRCTRKAHLAMIAARQWLSVRIYSEDSEVKICFISLATRRWWGPCVRTCSELSWVVLSRHWQPHRRRRSRPVGSPPSSPATRRSRRWPLVAEPQVVPVSRGMAPHGIHARQLLLRFRQCFGGEKHAFRNPKMGHRGTFWLQDLAFPPLLLGEKEGSLKKLHLTQILGV